MKKFTVLALFAALLLTGKSLVAQEGENDLKNFRFGIYGQPAISWYKPDNPDIMESKGSKLTFAYGLLLEFRLNKVACISTGLAANYSGGRLGFKTDTIIYSSNNDADTFRLLSRDYKVSYAEVPFTIKMKTPEIGAFTYFGQFGVNIKFKTKAKSITDDGFFIQNKAYVSGSKNNVDISNDMAFLNLGLNIGGGLEYNLAGSTSLIFSVNYNNGFMNVLRTKSKSLQKLTTTVTSGIPTYTYEEYEQIAKPNYVSFSVGFLF
ncbi:MAG: outer membrane beta-barrel protein [Bacteroidota bacterium]